MKHYVITPFYPYAKKPLTDEVLFSRDCDVLDTALRHFGKYLLPSLVNQTTHDFTLLLGVNKDLGSLRPDIFVELTNQIRSVPFKMEVLDWFSYYKFINEHWDDRVISTRIDHDDCLGNDVLQMIQERATFKEPFEFFAFMSGAIYWEETGKVCRYVSPTWRDGLSSFSATPTMYCRWNEIHALPVHGHTRVTSITNPLGISLQPGVNHFLDYDHELSWLYVRHGRNRSRESWYRFGEEITADLSGKFGLCG